jgi:hypothetical protein
VKELHVIPLTKIRHRLLSAGCKVVLVIVTCTALEILPHYRRETVFTVQRNEIPNYSMIIWDFIPSLCKYSLSSALHSENGEGSRLNICHFAPDLLSCKRHIFKRSPPRQAPEMGGREIPLKLNPDILHRRLLHRRHLTLFVAPHP